MSKHSIEITLENMLVEDLELLDAASSGELSAKELVDFLDRVTVQDVRKKNIMVLRNLVERLTEAVSEATNPEDESGN